MIDLETKNKSFLNEYIRLANKGVKADFLLELKDETIKGLDPYSESLTIEQKIRIYLEIVRNEFYFIREVVKIPVGLNNETIKTDYIINSASAKFFYTQQFPSRVFLDSVRQSGRTLMVIINSIWKSVFSEEGRMFFTISDAIVKCRGTYGKMYPEILKSLPEWLLNMSMSEKDKAEADRLVNKQYSNKNSMDIILLPGQEAKVNQFGIGFPICNWVVDSPENNKFFQEDAVQSELFKDNNTGNKVLIVKCPKDLTTDENDKKSKFYKDLLNNSILFTDDLYMLPESIRNQLFYGKYIHIKGDWIALGMSEAKINQEKNILSDEEFRTNYLCEWIFKEPKPEDKN